MRFAIPWRPSNVRRLEIDEALRREIGFQIRQICTLSRIFGTPEESSIDAGVVMLEEPDKGAKANVR